MHPTLNLRERKAVSLRLFTSESVTEGHPDKIADQISDAILDQILLQDPGARVAAEVLVTTGMALVSGEITTEAYVEIPAIVRQTPSRISDTSTRTSGSTGIHARSSPPSTSRRWTSPWVSIPGGLETRA